MKLSRTLHTLCLVLFANNIISMEAPPVESRKPLTPYQRSASHEAVKYACLCISRKQINLDQFFDRILPSEVAQNIIDLAYKKDLQAYFFSEERLIDFFHGSYFCYWQTNLDLSSTIRSSPNQAHRHTNLEDLTCALKLKNDHHATGFSDGKIILFNPTMQNPHDTGAPYNSPVSAFAEKFRSDSSQPLLIAGYHDGSVAVFSFKTQRMSHYSKILSAPISCIAPTQIPNMCLISSGNTIALTRLKGIDFDNNKKEEAGFHARTLKLSNIQKTITGIGLYEGKIVAQTTKNQYLLVAPYSESDQNTIENCTFSPLQARYLYRMMLTKEYDTESPSFDIDELIAFRRLSSDIQKLFEVRHQ